MTDTLAPSALQGNTLEYASSAPAVFGLAFPWMASQPTYTDLPPYWSPRRDWVLSNTTKKEDMWAAAVAIAATRFASHGYTVKDSKDSNAARDCQPGAAEARQRRRGLGAVRA
jgi:hypothetical protein